MAAVPPAGWAGVRRLLAVRLDNVGDVVMLGPALRELKRALPDASVTLMASPAGAQAAPLLPWVDDVLQVRALWQDASGALPFDPPREAALIEDLRAREFDAAVIFTSFSQTPFPPAYACYLAGIPIRLGQSADFGGVVLSHQIAPPPVATHQAERNLHLLRRAGFAVERDDLELCVPFEARRAAVRLLRAHGLEDARLLVVAPGASCDARRYDRWASAAALLAREHGLAVAVVGSAREAALCEAVRGDLERSGVRAESLAGATSVPELAAVIERATLVLANNSGPLHLAEALRRPMAIAYAGTDLEGQWRPRHAPHVVLRRTTGCSPCYAFDCPYEKQCLDLDPAEVARAASTLLAREAVPA